MGKLYPLEDFIKNAESAGYTISDDGSKLAFLRPWKSRMNIFVRDIDSGREWRITSEEDRGVSRPRWKESDFIFYSKDKGGDENTHIYVVDVDGGVSKDLTPFDGAKSYLSDIMQDDPDHVLISSNKRDKKIFDLYKCNFRTGDIEMVYQNPGDASGWSTDDTGKVRFVFLQKGLSTDVLYRGKDENDFHKILEMDYRDIFAPTFFHKDNPDLVYVASNLGRDKVALFLYNAETGENEELIFEHSDVDASGFTRSRKTKEITGVRCVNWELESKFIDRNRKSLQDELDKIFDGYQVMVQNMDKNEKRMVIVVCNNQTPGAYYLYDWETKELTELGEVCPWIVEEDMAEVKYVTYEARDGLRIPAYLTLPNGARENIPLVVLPHGGPSARDVAGFDSEVQMLANRGIAVLQPNFRGSTGYGRSFQEAGFKQWGRGMQNDLTDGVKWAIKQGIADPGRVAIFGGSYGGYAALAGATFTPDLYACAVDIVGPSNLFTMMESIPPYWELERQIEYEEVGDPEKDKEMLEEVSPLFHAENITIPLLVAQGANDPRVNKLESDRIVDAVRKNGKEVVYLVKDNEGHGFSNEENRFELYREIEKFLNKHLELGLGIDDD